MSSQQIKSLYKFCDIETALRILQSSCLRFSSPHLFEDPHEPDCNTPLPFDDDGFLKAYLKEACGYLFAKEDPPTTNALFAAIDRWRHEGRFHTEEEAEVVLKDLLKPMSEVRLGPIKKRFNAWQKFAKRVRIASFTSNPGYLMSWRSMAANHHGVALRFSSSNENILAKPHQVIYRDTPPYLITLAEEMKRTFGLIREQERIDAEDYYELLTLKARSFKEEKEWRCFFLEDESKDLGSDQSQWYIDREFDAADLTGIVFGYNVTEADRARIMDSVKTSHTHSKLFQVSISEGSYSLEFDKR